MNQKHIEKEWNQLLKTESRFLQSNRHQNDFLWQKKLDKVVPEKLNQTLDAAFYKAFQLIFQKGTGVIEKTFDPEKRKQDYEINEFAARIRKSRRSLRAFEKQANLSKNTNTIFTAVEGIGMGAIGLGIPDIPLFLSILLKSIYEISLSYGFEYDTEEEQIFILKLIEVSLSHEDILLNGNTELNEWMDRESQFDINLDEQIKASSKALSRELLYLKFIQGIPLIGIVGGVSDVIYQKKVTDYAANKYKRRFFTRLGK